MNEKLKELEECLESASALLSINKVHLQDNIKRLVKAEIRRAVKLAKEIKYNVK